MVVTFLLSAKIKKIFKTPKDTVRVASTRNGTFL